jgi:hypothetical protein
MEMISLCGSCYKPNKTHLSTVITPRIPFFYLYYWVDISAGGPLFLSDRNTDYWADDTLGE